MLAERSGAVILTSRNEAWPTPDVGIEKIDRGRGTLMPPSPAARERARTSKE
jgi:hypothetical protein